MDIHFSLMGIYGKLYPFKSRNLSDRSLITDPQQIMIGRRCVIEIINENNLFILNNTGKQTSSHIHGNQQKRKAKIRNGRI